MNTMQVMKIDYSDPAVNVVWVEMLGQDRKMVLSKWIGEDRFMIENPENLEYARTAESAELSQVFELNPEVREALYKR
jgi:hypothetical protein